jgi:hypothetical protein
MIVKAAVRTRHIVTGERGNNADWIPPLDCILADMKKRLAQMSALLNFSELTSTGLCRRLRTQALY